MLSSFAAAITVGLLLDGTLAQDVKFNYSLWDNAPFLQYGGHTNSHPTQGWNQSYSGSPVGDYVAGKSLGLNVSSHSTVYSDMIMSLTTIATDVYFLGAGEGTVDLILDDGSSESQRDSASLSSPTLLEEDFPVLAHIAAPAFGNHEFKIKFTQTGYGFLAIQEVIVTVVIGLKPKYVLEGIDGDMAFGVTKSGNWTAVTETCDKTPGADPSDCQDSADAAYLFSSALGDSLTFQAELNTSFVALHGPTGVEFGKYSVTLDARPYAGANPYVISPNIRYNDVGQVMYINSLDPQQQYTITVANEDDGKQVGLSKAVFLKHPKGEFGSNSNATEVTDHAKHTGGGSTSTESNLNIGAIAGGAAGGVVVVILIGVIAFLWCRRREADSDADDILPQRYEFDSVVTPMFPVDPYASPMSSTYTPSTGPSFAPGSNGRRSQGTTITQSSFGELNTPLMSQTSQARASMFSTSTTSDPRQVNSSFTKAQHWAQHAAQHTFPHDPVVTEEQDMGRVVETTVPPRYNPNWAETPLSEAPSGSSMPPGAASPMPPGAASPSQSSGSYSGMYPQGAGGYFHHC